MSNYFEELEKIANDLLPVDDEPMVDTSEPEMTQEEVDAIQSQNGGEATEQQPTTPEQTEELEAAMLDAQEDLETAKEHLASLQDQWEGLEKEASDYEEQYPTMGAFAYLLEYSTNEQVDEGLRKLARERLTQALTTEEAWGEVLTKTAEELFQTEEAVQELYSEEGQGFVFGHLEAFANDEELDKVAFDMGSIISKVKTTAGDYLRSARDLKQLKGELDTATAEVKRLSDVAGADLQAAMEAQMTNNPAFDELQGKAINSGLDHSQAEKVRAGFETSVQQGQLTRGAGGALAGAGGLLAGKKIYDAVHSEPDDELLENTASDKMNPVNSGNNEGGFSKMANEQRKLVNDYLTVAGAGALIQLANDESYTEDLRKEAADQFNTIATLGRKDMTEAFAKVATSLYSEDELISIVQGNHNEELFDKVAHVVAWDDMGANELDEMMKTAGNASSVAAKGVSGALTDASENIKENIQETKKKTETGHIEKNPLRKAHSLDGYNVINNPGSYKVEKTAAAVEEAAMNKQACLEGYAYWDQVLRENLKQEQ